MLISITGSCSYQGNKLTVGSVQDIPTAAALDLINSAVATAYTATAPQSSLVGIDIVPASASDVIAGTSNALAVTPLAMHGAGFKIGGDGLLDPSTMPNWTGENFVMVETTTTPTLNGAALTAALDTARGRTLPNGFARGLTNRIFIILPAARYLITTALQVDFQYCTFICLSGKAYIYGSFAADGTAPVVITPQAGICYFDASGISFENTATVTANGTGDGTEDHASSIRYGADASLVNFSGCDILGVNPWNAQTVINTTSFLRCTFTNVRLIASVTASFESCDTIRFYGPNVSGYAPISQCSFLNCRVITLRNGANISGGSFVNCGITASDSTIELGNGSTSNADVFQPEFKDCDISIGIAEFNARVFGGTITITGAAVLAYILAVSVRSIYLSGAAKNVTTGTKPSFQGCRFENNLTLSAAGTVDLVMCSLPFGWSPTNVTLALPTGNGNVTRATGW